MRRTQVWITLCLCLAVMAVLALAQPARKPGLWEMTTVMTWQQSPFPPNMPMPPGGSSPFGGGPHVTQICLTQAIIDRYGGPVPQQRTGCQMVNVVKGANSMTADWICNGMMSGKGALETHWSDDGTAKGKVHFVGSMQMGPNPRPVEWTTEYTSVYKGPDCGNVKPPPLPDK